MRIRQQILNWSAEDYGREGGILDVRKGLFKWRLEGSIGSAPRMSSCNLRNGAFADHTKLQSPIVKTKKAEPIDSVPDLFLKLHDGLFGLLLESPGGDSSESDGDSSVMPSHMAGYAAARPAKSNLTFRGS